MTQDGIQQYDVEGRRKYKTADERGRFLSAAKQGPRETRTFCLVMAYISYRVSEALALTADRVDLEEVMVFKNFKKRRSGLYRAVPVPSGV